MTGDSIESAEPRQLVIACFYINAGRLAQFVSAGEAQEISYWQQEGALLPLAPANLLAASKRVVQRWVSRGALPTLGKALIRGESLEGRVVTHFDSYLFRGVRKSALSAGAAVPLNASARTQVDLGEATWNVNLVFNARDVVSPSAFHHLSGRSRQMVIGIVKSVVGQSIELIPIVIGSPCSKPSDDSIFSDFDFAWHRHLEVDVSQIDSFDKVKDVSAPNRAEVEQLRHVSEASVKNALAEIIGEAFQENDWGGESSDLYTSRLLLEGRPAHAAFLLKGPAKFAPMTVGMLGKNGDQIHRLYTEPADVFVLQHCHQITRPVRNMMRLYAQDTSRYRRFCVIDGSDTVRILTAYGKCGFG